MISSLEDIQLMFIHICFEACYHQYYPKLGNVS